MDPYINYQWQIDHAKRIMFIHDNPAEHGGYSDAQADELAELAVMLAEKVLALVEWKRKGGEAP